MYQCLICLDSVQEEGFCLCGRLHLDHKLRPTGEAFIKIQKSNEKSRLDTCPHCGWRGMVVPKLGLGCPDHGIWWYKGPEEKAIPIKKEEKYREEKDEEDVVYFDPSKKKGEKSKFNRRWVRPRRAVR